MLRIGITGGIGAGKSLSGDILSGFGVPVIDTDDLARRVVAPGTPGLEAILGRFGPDLRLPDGTLDRAGLARRIFADLRERMFVEGVLHPLIHDEWIGFLKAQAVSGSACAAVIIPLLFEKGYQDQFDLVVSLGCSAKTQHQRLTARAWNPEQIRQRLAAQWPMPRKMEASRFVVWSEGTARVTEHQWRVILDHLLPGFVAGNAARSGGN